MLDSSLWTRRNSGCIVAVVAHPDDETIGLGGQLGSIADITLVHVTDGAPRTRPDWKTHAQIRRAELLAAAAKAGIPEHSCLELGVADQEASMHLVELACFLSRLLDQLRPEVVFTHTYEGAHPDHDATAFAIHNAIRLRVERGEKTPDLIEFPSYHHRPRDGRIETGTFLPWPYIEPFRMVLSKEARSLKRRMLSCFQTQKERLANFPDDAESFRVAPAYDFTHAPHAELSPYGAFRWGVTGREWRRLARHAQQMLGSSMPLMAEAKRPAPLIQDWYE